MAQSPKNDSGMVPRSYQLEILEDIKKSNSILYLPTGCGKTYIATMLIKHMGECLTKPIGNGRKWTFFIVTSLPLLRLQSSNLRRHLPSWDIGEFSGDTSVVYHSKKHWDEILEKYQIIVITAQVYLNNLYRSFMHLKDANLLIFDECHHAVASHPFKAIMEVLHNSNLKSDERPHILGLTATLINSNTKNIKDELHKLQITFNSTIKTRYHKNITNFSARPKESTYLYDEHILDNDLLVVTYRISKIVNYIETIQGKSKNETELEINEMYSLQLQCSDTANQLENYFRDIEVHLNDGGAYIAYLNSLHFMREIEKKQKICQDIERFDIMSLVLSELTIIRKMLCDYMNKHSIIHKYQCTLQNVSPKVKKLMENVSALKATDTCLIFVSRRTTANTLYHYINDYIQEYNLKNIVCEFIVGGRGLFGNECKENNYKKQHNNDIIEKFNSKIINVLIASQILEEGVDIQTCNVVIKYDYCNSFTSYIQSKGRARSATSKFITMVSNSSYLKYTELQDDFNRIEKDIDEILAVNNIEDENNNNNNNDDNNMSTMFKTGHSTLNYANALCILNNYCNYLPQDKCSVLKPEWYITQDENNCKKYKLTLPNNSVIKTPIYGIFCTNKKDAKKSAAFNACIELYKVGALDDYFRPMSIENNANFNILKWLPHWDEEDMKQSKYNSKAGTQRIKRIVHAKSPTYLHGSYPQVNKPSYLHVIHCVPDYIQLKESKYEAFDTLLKSIKEFGILTSNKLPQVSSFPIFLHFGTVNVSIKVNVNVVDVDNRILKKLDNFHNKLFMDVLGVNKFVARSYDNGDNSYLVVPIFLIDNIYHLDLDVINLNKFVETHENPTREQINSKFNEEYLGSINIISPWYKNVSPVQRYIVTDKYMNKTPESSFESSEYDTNAKYFSDDYNIHDLNKNQPLIKVESLDESNINYLVPRHSLHELNKKTEHDDIRLIPEFCTSHKFPSDYWLKALMLPTILYRLEKLLLAEELCAKINSMCNIEVECSTNKNSLKIHNIFAINESQNENIVMEISKTLKDTHIMDEVLEFDPNNFSKDIERIRNLTKSDLQNYQTFMYDQSEGNYNIVKSHCKVLDGNSKYDSKKQIDEVIKIESNEMNTLHFTNNPPPILSPLIKKVSKQIIRPEQFDILKAITPPKAKDMFNYECMETYGDSFLKFYTGLVLFDAYPLQDEGFLTKLRTKIVGNQHLYYVGINSNIVSYMINHFDPNTDFIPPCFGVPKKIKDIINDNNISPDAIYQVIIPKDDQITGMLSDETCTKIENKLLLFKKLSTSSSDDNNYTPQMDQSQSDKFKHKKSLSDKMVADCVESLIGTYVYKYGVEVGIKVLHGLGIIPEQLIETFKPKPIENQRVDLNILKYLPGYEILEQKIGYSFKHKHLLVQAVTHTSNEFSLPEDYQRLEFLGDAIIEFLITSYIMEHGNTKTPGKITDIRASLVNNKTIGSLSARIGLHRFVLAQSVKMIEAIDRFYKYFQIHNYQIGKEVLCLSEENDFYAAEYIVVPKVLSDLFESLIAAIYLDCNRDLNVVWTILYRLMGKEINEFCNNIPTRPIDILNKLNLQPIFRTVDAYNNALNKRLQIMIQLQISSNQKSLIVYGFGQNKKEAKIAAAVMALKHINKMS